MSNRDKQGVLRGACNEHKDCVNYILPTNGSNDCDYCGCKPPKHANLSNAAPAPTPSPVATPTPKAVTPTPPPTHTTTVITIIPVKPCLLPGCDNPVAFSSGDFCSEQHAREGILLGLLIGALATRDDEEDSSKCKMPGCGKAVFVEPSGKAHQFCGRRHAQEYAATGRTSSSPKQSSHCSYPGCSKPCYVDGNTGKVHPYCSREHAKQASLPPNVYSPPSSPHIDASQRCVLPSCTKTRYYDTGNSRYSEYCGLSHRNQDRSRKDSIVTLIDKKDPRFDDVAQQFLKKWLHQTGSPQVVSVLRIHPSAALNDRYDNYKASIIAKRPEFKEKGHGAGGPGNEHRRFHGTSKMACNLGLNNNSTLCTTSGCNVCGIIRTGLLLNKAQTNISFGRFGRGLYLTSTSSKSHSYNTGTSNGLGAGYRCMFICKVIIGKGKQLYTDDTTLTDAPHGYDSVLGEVGQNLNYDEVIVYNQDAVLPSYMVVYRE